MEWPRILTVPVVFDFIRYDERGTWKKTSSAQHADPKDELLRKV